MTYSPNEVWSSFIESFKSNLNQINSEANLAERLKSYDQMTFFYKKELFPKIANDLSLECDVREYLRMDMYLYRQEQKINEGPSYQVPIIFVESENDQFGDLPNEVHKLLSVNSSLKILMTRNPFQIEDNYWVYLVKDFSTLDRLVGYFAVISAVWEDGKLYYDYIVYDEKGVIVMGIDRFAIG